MNDNDLFRIDKPRISIPEEQLIRELKAFSRLNNGKPISQTAYNKWVGRRFSGETISRCFGSWEKGCERAGVNFFKKHKYSDKELIDHFEKVWRWRGQRLVTKDLKEYNKKYGTTIHPVLYTRRWGEFQEFVQLFSKYKLGQITFEQLQESKKQENIREPISPSLRAKVLRRDNYRCKDCGASPENDQNITLHIHHMVPVSKGGKTVLSNLVTNCNRCNLGKSDKIF